MNEERYNMQRERMLSEQLMQAQINSQNMNQATQSMLMSEGNQTIISEQLDLSEQLELIENLLRGKVRKKDKNGDMVWIDSLNPNNILLTETGVTEVMNMINWYINKNTLLSNYDEDTILNKMKDFANALNDLLFMNYHIYFEMPTLDDCKKEFQRRIDKKMKIREFAHEILGVEFNENEIREEFIKEFADKIEKELEEIRESLFEQKLARYEMIVRVIQDSVHSTYLRALFGAERRTLRQHIHVTESTNPQLNSMKKGGLFSNFKFHR